MIAHDSRVAHQYEKRGLEGVFNICRVGENLATCGQYARTMPTDDSLKCDRIAMTPKLCKQVGIRGGIECIGFDCAAELPNEM